MLAAKNFQSGLQTLRQIEFSLFDMRLHYDFDAQPTAQDAQGVLELLEEVRDEVAVVMPPACNVSPTTSPTSSPAATRRAITATNGPKCFPPTPTTLFEENGRTLGTVLDPATGERFWREILAVGGARPALESFKAFRGREPKVDALLRHNGMVPA